MSRIILAQHCQSQHHLDRPRQFPDRGNGLTELGLRQAQALAARLAQRLTKDDVRLYSSDMTRARETAEILSDSLGMTPTLCPELREWSDPHTLERTEPPELVAPSESESLFDWRPYPGHESWREFLGRVSAFMERLSAETDGEVSPLIVAHGGTLSNIVVWWLGIPIDCLPERTCFAGSPGSISVLLTNKCGNRVVERLNDTAHLH